MRFGERVIQFKRPTGACLGLTKCVRRIHSAHDRQDGVGNRHARIGGSVDRINVDGLPAKLDTTLQSFRGPFVRVMGATQ